MAAGRLSAPGSPYGPCFDGCEHRDCAETRRMALMLCHWCNRSIGYDTRFYRNNDGDLVHATCEEGAVEREQAARRRP